VWIWTIRSQARKILREDMLLMFSKMDILTASTLILILAIIIVWTQMKKFIRDLEEIFPNANNPKYFD
jgi:hypothetical protein